MNLKITIVLLLLLINTSFSMASGNPGGKEFRLPANISASDMVDKTIIFKLKPAFRSDARISSVENQNMTDVLNAMGATSVVKKFPAKSAPSTERNAQGMKMVDLSLIYQVKYTSSEPIETLVNAIIRTGMVEYAEPKYLPKLLFTPNDPNTGMQYFLNKIQAYAAWDIQQGDTNVVIGITDTGSDLDHPDLEPNLKYNYADPIDGIDNDGDTYVDNFRGWDLGENDNNATVGASNHGSHVSGCAAAATNNNTGVASPGFNCKFLPVKIADATGALTEAYEGITYAADAGCQIINCSWGGGGGGSFGQDVVDYATINQNALVVASAGNDNTSDTFYPAGYNFVLCVGSTTNSDAKSSFSNYGANIDVCAPGSNIYTAMSNNTYGTMSGTSMAGPVACGAAAIILSEFPTMTALQVGEQLRVTCDNIYSVPSNNVYQNMLGKGRINMFRALTETGPSVRMTNIVSTDGNDDAFIIGDTVRIAGDITNYLDPTVNLDITLTTTSPWVTIIDNNTVVGVLGTLATVNNNGDPFLLKINAGTPQNTQVTLKLNYADGSYTDFQIIDLIVNVDYINVTINQISTTITSKGRIGYNGIGQTEGLGFQYNGTNLAYELGLMIGQSSSKVSDVVRADPGATDTDFQSAQVIQKLTPSVQSEFDLYGKFNDNLAAIQIPVLVSHKAFAWTTPGDEKYVIVEYSIKNSGSSSMSNLWAGIFADWDIQDYNLNKGDENAALKMGYVYNTTPGGLWAGIKVLTPTPFNHYAGDNLAGQGGIVFTDGYDTAEKYTSLSTPRQQAGVNGGGNDVLDIVSTGPFTLAAGDSVRVAFALLAGDDLSDLNTSAGNAQIKYDNLVSVPENGSVNTDILLFPNPASNLIYIVSGNTNIESYTITDVAGRILSLNTAPIKQNGMVQVDLASYQQGVYLVNINSGNSLKTFKFIKQ